MKTIQLLLTLTIFVASCQPNQSEKKVIFGSGEDQKYNKRFSVIDSLNKYLGSDSLFIFNDTVIYVGKANRKDFGLFQYTDTSFVLYQKEINSWRVTDTFNFPLAYVFKPQDLNGDSYKDIIITYHVTGAGGNGENICLIFNPKTEIFYHNKYFDLPNIQFDKKSNMVLSAWWAGVVQPQQKMTYLITGDSLTFNKGITYFPPEETNLDIANVELYTLNGDKRIILKKFRGDPEKMLNFFNQYFWDTSDE